METTQDGFLGGRLQLYQPKTGYRAGIDPVLLAAACPVKPGEHVLELGCGVGVASLCLALEAGPSLGVSSLDGRPAVFSLPPAPDLSGACCGCPWGGCFLGWRLLWVPWPVVASGVSSSGFLVPFAGDCALRRVLDLLRY